MKKFIYSYPVVLSLLWALIIFILCATPGQYIPSADWMDLLSVDKLVHAAVFFTLSALLLVVTIKYAQTKIFIIAYIILGVMYGILMEVMQALYFSNRSADWMDVIANSCGSVIALVFFRKLKRWMDPALT